MAHWAEIDETNIVLRVLVGDNNDPRGDEGYQWLIDNLGGTWVKTSYNSYAGKKWETISEIKTLDNGEDTTVHTRIESSQPHFRFNYAGIGYLYDPIRDAFIPSKPEEGNWELNEDTCLWENTDTPIEE